jgi:ribosomal-protein-alanine N-acetyltransferase
VKGLYDGGTCWALLTNRDVIMSTLSHPSTYTATLRWLITADLPAVLQLADDCLGLQWTAEDFQECFRSLDTIGKVVEIQGMIIAFLIYQLDRDAHEVAIKSIAVAPGWQRHGVGQSMVQALDRKLSQGYERISAMVPESNLSLQLMLRSAGFRAVRVLRRWYNDEDAYLMQKDVPA